jgi:hypothetical protein
MSVQGKCSETTVFAGRWETIYKQLADETGLNSRVRVDS